MTRGKARAEVITRWRLTSSSKGTWPLLPMPELEVCMGRVDFFSGRTLIAAFWIVSRRGMMREDGGEWRRSGGGVELREGVESR